MTSPRTPVDAAHGEPEFQEPKISSTRFLQCSNSISVPHREKPVSPNMVADDTFHSTHTKLNSSLSASPLQQLEVKSADSDVANPKPHADFKEKKSEESGFDVRIKRISQLTGYDKNQIIAARDHYVRELIETMSFIPSKEEHERIVAIFHKDGLPESMFQAASLLEPKGFKSGHTIVQGKEKDVGRGRPFNFLKSQRKKKGTPQDLYEITHQIIDADVYIPICLGYESSFLNENPQHLIDLVNKYYTKAKNIFFYIPKYDCYEDAAHDWPNREKIWAKKGKELFDEWLENLSPDIKKLFVPEGPISILHQEDLIKLEKYLKTASNVTELLTPGTGSSKLILNHIYDEVEEHFVSKRNKLRASQPIKVLTPKPVKKTKKFNSDSESESHLGAASLASEDPNNDELFKDIVKEAFREELMDTNTPEERISKIALLGVMQKKWNDKYSQVHDLTMFKPQLGERGHLKGPAPALRKGTVAENSFLKADRMKKESDSENDLEMVAKKGFHH